MNTIFSEVKRALQKKELSKERIELLHEVEKYILSGDWTTNHKLANEVSKAYRLGVPKAANSLGISLEQLKSSRRKASQMIRKIIGTNIIYWILNGRDAFIAAREQFNFVRFVISPLDFLLPGVDSLVNNKSSKQYKLCEVKAEMNFLKRYTTKAMTDEFLKLDTDKLAYIYNELSLSSRLLTSERAELFKEFCGVFNTVVDYSIKEQKEGVK